MTVGRRTFLRAAGLGTLGVVAAACSPDAKPAQQPSATATPTPPPSTSAKPSGPPDWNALKSKLSGDLLLPGDGGFATARHGFNPLFDGHTPAAVAKVAKAEDVQACFEAAAQRLPIAARSGGHSYAGYSTPDGGLIVDVGGMAQVQVQGEQVVIGAGARLGDVYAALAKAGRCLPAGSCPTVGIAGLTLGGGIGVVARKYGLTCDRLVSAQVVTPDGKLRTASADSEPDLFWALRGGGGGNFGIVTSFTFRTDPAPDITVFSLHFPGGSAGDVLDAWQQWLPTTPPELWSNLVVSGGSPVACRVGGAFVGSSNDLTALLGKLGASPSSRTMKSLSYGGAMNYFSGSSARQTFVASSRIITDPVQGAKVSDLAAGHKGMDLLIDGLGGAVADLSPTDTAFPHRKALASIQVYAPATTGNHSSVAKNVSTVVSGLADAGAGGGYVNYVDPAMPDWKTAYYGENAARLEQVAKTYDPDGVLKFAQSA
ncbi:FAD-binding oxidoreductase [Amycolatopsis sp. FDAARGOS 1241]|uniref:FAD-binding oxidoreductase n=1 Tax=Amycolatopsis sp. FDAARGOS 1241 TaxID=2778070 RepID=UPI00194FBE6B|nr:FAD-binding oxidoreductase [Amycolatopsis sp. FDAARGOS 1241]QRP45311.1 FAD-binding oxidoreductase [Amycolatopsis sp. FDAARGOS 1241]